MGQITSIRAGRLSGDGRPVRLADEPFLDSIVPRIDDEQRVAQRIEEDTLRGIQKITSNTGETGETSDRRATGIPTEGPRHERRRVGLVGRHQRPIGGENGQKKRGICWW